MKQFEAYMMIGHHTLITIETVAQNKRRVISYTGAAHYQTPHEVVSDPMVEITHISEHEREACAAKTFMKLCVDEQADHLEAMHVMGY